MNKISGLSIHHRMMMYSFYYIGASKERIAEASIIRLGFFLEMNLTDAYSQLLAYLAISHFGMISIDNEKPVLSISQIIKKIFERREYFKKVNLSGIVIDRMKIIDSNQVFRDILSHPVLFEGEKTQKELLDFLIKIYWLTSNFTIMHGFNSFLSFQQILSMMDDEKQAIQSYFIGLMSAFLTIFRLYDYSNITQQINNIEIQENLLFMLCTKNSQKFLIASYFNKKLHKLLNQFEFSD
ncbi:hypothetical protein ABPG72_005994 [Tetrahymena utriculariae]